eukprot:GFKZ01005353.1.p1 GENE.GFKZ01005353.1~~GFKZ01005353.1.p1  ORF type:complete len:1512 (+),score=393.95 GFKZ01005353.1:89-4537(+)
MAAATVPSRARAHPRPPHPPSPSSSEVTYMRMTLEITSLRGAHLSPDPVQYSFRWIRASKTVKSTSAHSIEPTTHAFSGRMTLYARVKRVGSAFVPEDSAEPLQTELILAAADPSDGTEPTPVANAAFDVAAFLHRIVQGGLKSLATEISFTAGITAGVVLSVKAIGENFMTPLDEDVVGRDNSTGANGNLDQLERLKEEVREKEERIDRLAASTEQLDIAVKQTAEMAEQAAIEDVGALKERVRSLEQSNAVLEKERADSVRKVEAHVAHAARIRETYSRLAAWYNNLRTEHEELQKKLGVEPGAEGNAASGHREEVKSLEKERDDLQEELDKERRKSKEFHSRNSALLESKAKTLAELGLQWESAQTTLKETENALQLEKDNAEELRNAVEELTKQLAKRDTLLEERGTALSSATERVEEVKSRHVEDLKAVKERAEEDAKAALDQELDSLKVDHQQEISRLVNERKIAIEEAVDRQKASLKADYDAKLEESRRDLENELAQKHASEVEELRKEYEIDLQKRSEVLEQTNADARESLQSLQEQLAMIQLENENLRRKETESSQIMTDKETQHERALNEASSNLQVQLNQVRGAKEEIEKNLADAEERMLAARRETAEAREISDRNREIADKELGEARAEIATLRKEKEDLQSSPPETAADQSESVAQLEEELSKMKAVARSEKGKRSDMAELLAAADSEHDELRAMVTRLRSERDKALQELNREREIVPNPRVNIDAVQKGAYASSADGEASSLSEERDKAIRELFRVRKNLNKQIKILKKENLNLNQKLADGGQPMQSEDVKASPTDEGRAIAELKKLREVFPTTSPKSLSSQSGSLPEEAGDLSSKILTTIASLRSDIEQLRSANEKLSNDSRDASRKNSDEVAKLIRERDDTLREMGNARKERDDSNMKMNEKDRELASLSAHLESSAQKEGELARRYDEANHERQKAVEKSASLTAEVASLRESLRKASSYAPSLEMEIERVQKQNAEIAAALSASEVSHQELTKAAEEREEELRNEITQLRGKVEEKESSARALSERLHQSEDSISRELALRDNEGKEIDAILQNLKAQNDAMTAKLVEEQNLREMVEQKMNNATEEIKRLQSKVQSLEVKEQSATDAVRQIEALKEKSDSALAEMKKQLEMAESRVAEQRGEIDELQSQVNRSESSRRAFEEEAIAAGGKSQAVEQELANLRTELEKARSDLQQSLRSRELDVEKVTAQSQREEELIQSLRAESESLSRSNSELQSTNDSIVQELQAVSEVQGKTASMLRRAQQEMELRDKTAQEMSDECEKLRLEIGRLSSINQESQSSQAKLAELDLLSKQEMASMNEELAELRDEKQVNMERVSILEQELSEIHKRAAMVQEESDEAIALAKLKADKEARKVADMRKELRTAKSTTDSLQAEVDRLLESNADLRKEAEDLKKSADNRDSEVLQDLINTRMELAYSEEETIRLRNKLKKLGQSSQGSGPFDR